MQHGQYFVNEYGFASFLKPGPILDELMHENNASQRAKKYKEDKVSARPHIMAALSHLNNIGNDYQNTVLDEAIYILESLIND